MSLSGLDKLSKLVYQVSKSDDILDLIIEQLQQVSSTNDIREVVFDFDWTVTVNISKWKDIDSLLVGDKFKRLHKVGVCPDTHHKYLPQIHNAGLLTVYKNTHWR